MHVTLTIKIATELPAQVAECKKHFARLRKEGVFGPPNGVDIRYMLIVKEEVAEEAQEKRRGIPEVE